MAGKTTEPTTAKRLHWWAPLLLAVAILVLAFTGSTHYSLPGNIDAAVNAWGAEHPGQPVPLLIQTSDPGAVAELIRSSDGQVTRQFSIVPAVEAELDISAATTLASDPAVRWISLNAQVQSMGTVDASKLSSIYPSSSDATTAWSKGFTGAGIGVAIVDTGISPDTHADFVDSTGKSRVVARVEVNASTSSLTDGYGHGTHIAGIVGGDGSLMSGKYIGIAPDARLIEVKVADDSGIASMGDVVAGLEWVYTNKSAYNIRVVNLSLRSSTAESYRTSPVDAAVEALWLNGIFVVVAAGNDGAVSGAVDYPPANDPFVMTVGALDDMGTTSFSDDVVTSWSSRGTTQDGFAKPELYTPGRNIVSLTNTSSILWTLYPTKIVDQNYFSLSGTSMAAGVMSGTAALVLEAHPTWTPGQLKCTLTATARQLSGGGFKAARAGSAAAAASASCNSDVSVAPSTAFGPMMKTGAVAWVLGEPSPNSAANSIGMDMAAANIQNANLNTVKWDAIKWGAIKWDAIKWGSVKWDAIKWGSVKWDAIKWSQITRDNVDFTAIKWSAIKWSDVNWSAIKWSAVEWDAIKWSAIKWSAIKWSFMANN